MHYTSNTTLHKYIKIDYILCPFKPNKHFISKHETDSELQLRGTRLKKGELKTSL